MKIKIKSAMNQAFASAWWDAGSCQWLEWLGQPMLYDGGLFVTREGF